METSPGASALGWRLHHVGVAVPSIAAARQEYGLMGFEAVTPVYEDPNQKVRVQFVSTGAQPKAQMPAYLAASDVCIATLQNIPMFSTTYPNKVFDYMAAGRPTLLAIDGVIREVIEAADGGVFVPPRDDLALAQGVVALTANPQVVEEMGRSAHTYVAAHFDRADHARQFVVLLRNLGSHR